MPLQIKRLFLRESIDGAVVLGINNQTEREKPAAKDLDVLDVMNWTQGEINNLSVENRNTNEIIVPSESFRFLDSLSNQ